MAKPDPRILSLALAVAGWFQDDSRPVLFVGDSLRIDGEAARRARVPFRHYDPFSDCGRRNHDHLHHLTELPFAFR